MNKQVMVTTEAQRAADHQHTSFERDSLFQRHFDGYYFTTREGMLFGPYIDLAEAKQARELFVLAVCGEFDALRTASAKLLLDIEEIDYAAAQRQNWAA